MVELTTRSINAIGMMIQGANDQVFAGTGLVRITLRILVGLFCFFIVINPIQYVVVQWPGYEHVDWARSIEVNAQGPMTRAQLAVAVAKNFSHFLEVSQSCFLGSVFFRIILTTFEFPFTTEIPYGSC